MDTKQPLENIKDLNLFFDAIGFDEKTKANHLGRIMTIILASVSEKLDRVTTSKDSVELPAMESIDDFYDHYAQHVDRATINKIIEEETYKAFAGYFGAIANQLPK